MEIIARWFLYFMIYSALGYIFEVIYCAICSKKLQGRGFLFGPICPIYGYGMILILLCHQWLEWPWWATFFMVIILCDILEYFTSLFLEKMFRVRWWDYSKSTKFSIGGRIALETSLLFGIGGLIVIYLIQPMVVEIVNLLPSSIMILTAIVLFIAMLFDTIFSSLAAFAIKREVKSGSKIDLTPDIKKFNRDYYRKHNRVERKMTRKAKRAAKRG